MKFKPGAVLKLAHTGNRYACSPVEDPEWDDVWVLPRSEIIARAVMEIGAVSGEDSYERLVRRKARGVLLRYMRPEARNKMAVTGSNYFRDTLSSMRDEIASFYID